MEGDLPKLLERVKKATGPDRQIDRAIMRTIGGWHRVEPRFTHGKHGGWIAPADFIGTLSDGSPILDSLHGTSIHREVPEVSASLDAALALVEEKLPGCGVCFWRHPGSAWAGEIELSDETVITNKHGRPTPALAVLSALIRALIAESSVSLAPTDGGRK